MEQLLGDSVGRGLSSRPGRIGEGTEHRAEGKCRAMSAREMTLIWGQQGPWRDQETHQTPSFTGEDP